MDLLLDISCNIWNFV